MNFSEMEDNALVSLIREQKNDEAFGVLCKRYLNLQRRRVSAFWKEYFSCQPEDLEQVAMLALYRAAVCYDPERNVPFAAYAENVIHNSLCDFVRSIGYAAVPMPDNYEDAKVPAVSSPEEAVKRRESMDRLLIRIRDTLSSYEFSVFTRHVLLGEKLADVAEGVGKDVHSVENAVSRAKAKLRRELTPKND